MAKHIYSSHRAAFLSAFPHTIPVLTGYLTMGVAYGVLMQINGYGAFWSVLMSLVAFCGSMQYAAISLLTSAFNPLQALLLSLTVNARHLFYGLSMLEKYQGLKKTRLFLIFSLSDETFSISSSVLPPASINRKFFYFWISFLDYFYWALGTLLGALLGSLITFNTAGLDFVLTALFVVLFLEQIKTRTNLKSGLVGILSTILCLILLGANQFVIPAMILIVVLLMIWRKRVCI
jgi:4-azaleucine resistance transporter AzlC